MYFTYICFLYVGDWINYQTKDAIIAKYIAVSDGYFHRSTVDIILIYDWIYKNKDEL